MQKLNRSRDIVLSIAVLLAGMTSPVFAEDKKPEQPLPRTTYRVEFTVKELEGSKQVNSRRYMMNVENREWGKVRVGSRVPIQTNNGGENNATSFQWQDVGMNIDCMPTNTNDGLHLTLRVESSSLANPVQANRMLPVFGQQRLEAGGVVALGKPTLMGSMDDTVSSHRYDVEVTVTEVK